MADPFALSETFEIRHKQGTAAPWEENRTVNPSRGLNLLVSDILVNDKEFTAGTKNVEYSEGGAAGKRMGYTADSATGLVNPLHGVGQYVSEAANYVIGADGGTLKKRQSGVWTSLSGSVTVDVTARISFTALYQKTYGWDGVLGGVVWDGSTLTRPGTMPRAKFSVIYKGYHVATGVSGQPFRLYFAPANDPSRFTRLNPPTDPNDVSLADATNVPGATVFTGDDSPRAIDIEKNNGQAVTGLGFFQDVLVVFKENSIYQLSFNDSNGFVVQRISSTYGCVSHWSICAVENDTYFLTDQGVYVLGNEPNYYAAIRTNELSSRIKPLIKQITPANYDRCNATYYDDRYFLSVPISNTSVNAMIVYDRRFYAWAYWDNIFATSMLVFKDKDNDGTKHFYWADNSKNQLQEFLTNTYNDNGAAINCVIVTRAFYGKQLDREKFWSILRPIFRRVSGDVFISYITEDGSAGTTARINTSNVGGIGTDEFGALLLGTSQQDTYSDADLGLAGGTSTTTSSATDTSHIPFEVSVLLDSRTIKIQYSNANLNETFALLGWAMMFQTKDVERFRGGLTIR